MTYTPKILEALELTYSLHGTQTRKGGSSPYITHLLAVASLVGEYGGSESQFIAALLHDAVEDQGGKAVLDRIRSTFGPNVADLVWACSDAWGEPKPPWEARKEAHIARIPDEPRDARLIIAADKLHNMQSMLRAYTPADDAVYWKQFRGGREGTLWYLETMGAALSDGWSNPILVELEETMDRFKHRIGRRS